MNKLLQHIKLFSLLSIIVLLGGCATYYAKNLKFQTTVEQGEFEKANKLLDKDKKGEKGKNKVLHYLNRGYVSWMMQDYETSNRHFATADRIIEDQLKNLGLEALALISNPMVKPYKVEDFETVLLNFYKTLNYLKLNQFDEAMVECKKMNIKLHQLNDKYKDNKNRYQRDAFSHIVMGLIYESNKNYNDAFIAYRNAYEVYKKDYTENFGVVTPEQLKKDILRTAYLTGFHQEVRQYEKEFGIKYKPNNNKNGELVFFWLNGFGPVKSEWSINFSKLDGKGGFVTFQNEEMGLDFPFYIGDFSSSQKSAFADLSFLRVAFPKYVERQPVFESAYIKSNSTNFKLELAENINEIAFKTLHDRMVREMANSLLRLATKKAMEAVVRSQDQNIGALVSIANALTEKADTRNWQTLPYAIHYTRIPLKEGENQITLHTNSKNGERQETFNFTGKKGTMQFHYFHTLDSYPFPVQY